MKWNLSKWAEQICVMQCFMTIAPDRYPEEVMFDFDTSIYSG